MTIDDADDDGDAGDGDECCQLKVCWGNLDVADAGFIAVLLSCLWLQFVLVAAAAAAAAGEPPW